MFCSTSKDAVKNHGIYSFLPMTQLKIAWQPFNLTVRIRIVPFAGNLGPQSQSWWPWARKRLLLSKAARCGDSVPHSQGAVVRCWRGQEDDQSLKRPIWIQSSRQRRWWKTCKAGVSVKSKSTKSTVAFHALSRSVFFDQSHNCKASYTQRMRPEFSVGPTLLHISWFLKFSVRGWSWDAWSWIDRVIASVNAFFLLSVYCRTICLEFNAHFGFGRNWIAWAI